MQTKFDIKERCLHFSYAVIRSTRVLPYDIEARVLARESIRSACSIGANVFEGGAGHTKKEFINFFAIARKSAIETQYWIRLITLSYPEFQKNWGELLGESEEIGKILTTIIKNTKQNQN